MCAQIASAVACAQLRSGSAALGVNRGSREEAWSAGFTATSSRKRSVPLDSHTVKKKGGHCESHARLPRLHP